MARAKAKRKEPSRHERIVGGLILGGTAAGLLYYWYQSQKTQAGTSSQLPSGTGSNVTPPSRTTTPPRTTRPPRMSDPPPWETVPADDGWEGGSSTGGVTDW